MVSFAEEAAICKDCHVNLSCSMREEAVIGGAETHLILAEVAADLEKIAWMLGEPESPEAR
jgi:hypothetical protein